MGKGEANDATRHLVRDVFGRKVDLGKLLCGAVSSKEREK
jgi:hypothetical protein